MSRVYSNAANALRAVTSHKAGIKSAVYGRQKADGKSMENPEKKEIYALVSQTLKYSKVLRQICEEVGLLEQVNDVELLLILLYEHLMGKGIQGGGAVKGLIVKHDAELKKRLKRLKAAAGSDNNAALLPTALQTTVNFPRYVRVNTLKCNVDTAKTLLADFPDVKVDPHISDLLVLPPGTDLHAHAAVSDGRLVLQDKASCMPAFALLNGWEFKGDICDACAAPGNKTSQLAALNRRGTVFAFDKSPGRLRTLQQRMRQLGAVMVVAQVQDWLQVVPSDPKYESVRAILLDPSCSGSGMVQRVDHLVDSKESTEEERLTNLAQFQETALLHAMSFPHVQRIVYSTCSIHAEENEQVVAAVLKQRYQQFRLITALPTWHRRGIPFKGLTAAESECLVRADPAQDDTNGFFVALFERIEGSPPVPVTSSVSAPAATAYSAQNATARRPAAATKPAKKARHS